MTPKSWRLDAQQSKMPVRKLAGLNGIAAKLTGACAENFIRIDLVKEMQEHPIGFLEASRIAQTPFFHPDKLFSRDIKLSSSTRSRTGTKVPVKTSSQRKAIIPDLTSSSGIIAQRKGATSSGLYYQM